LGITDHPPSLYTYSSLSTVYQKCNRREYRPLQNPLILNTLFYNIPNLLEPLAELPYPSTNPYGSITLFTDRYILPPTYYKTFPTCYEPPLTRYKLPSILYTTYRRPTLSNMADISEQIDQGQEKWSQGVDLESISDVNNYIKFKTLKYRYFKLENDNLWEQYREDFADFTKAIFRASSLIAICKL
jgi:hypothetical protein